MEGNSSSKTAHWLIGILVVVVIAAGAMLIYLKGNKTEEIAVNTTPTTKTPAADTTDTTATETATAQTDISSTVTDLDDELTVIAEDETTDDDENPF